MKVKVKDEMDKIILTVSHSELLLINEALKNNKENINEDFQDKINFNSWDRKEFRDVKEIYNAHTNMIKKIIKKLKKINVY